MNDEELSDILSRSERIAPSDSFVSSVMGAVEREGMPSPLAFPWVRALPGLIGLVASLIAIFVVSARFALSAGGAIPAPMVNSALAVTQSYAIGWILVAIAVTLVSMFVPLRFAATRGPTPL